MKLRVRRIENEPQPIRLIEDPQEAMNEIVNIYHDLTDNGTYYLGRDETIEFSARVERSLRKPEATTPGGTA